MTKMETQALGAFGVIVAGDVTSWTSEADREALRALYRQHHLLVFRDQKIDRDAQLRFVGIFGDVIMNDPSGFISNVRKDFVGDNELVWHSDLIFTPEAHLGLSLYAVITDPGVSNTRFVDAEAALTRVPAALRERIEGRTALHISGGGGGSARNRGHDAPPGWPRFARPLISVNPQTGNPYLAATLSQTSHVEGVDQAESDAILDALTDILYDPAHIIEHEWRTGDLIVWDNLALQHSRDSLVGQGRRDLERVIFGGRPVQEQFPEWIAALRASLGTADTEMM